MALLKKKQSEDTRLKVGAVVSLIGVVVVNALATLLPINGKSTGEISDSYPNLFAPAGVTFSIWSVIYLSLWAYVVYQFAAVRGKDSKVDEGALTVLNTYFIGSSVLNIVWILAWHYEILWLTVILMLGLLYCLIRINVSLRNQDMSTRDKVFIRAPFSLYFGWITIATVANITTWLVSVNWDRFELREGVWMVAILLVSAVIAVVTILRQQDWVYGLVIVWAFAGILLKHLSTNGWNGAYPSVIVTLTILLPVIIVICLQLAQKDFVKR